MKVPIPDKPLEGEKPLSSTDPAMGSQCFGEIMSANASFALRPGDIVLLEWENVPPPERTEKVGDWIRIVEEEIGIKLVLVPSGMKVVR